MLTWLVTFGLSEIECLWVGEWRPRLVVTHESHDSPSRVEDRGCVGTVKQCKKNVCQIAKIAKEPFSGFQKSCALFGGPFFPTFLKHGAILFHNYVFRSRNYASLYVCQFA